MREIVASRVQAPPVFCTEAKVAKGGAYLRDTTVLQLILCIVSSIHVCTYHLVYNGSRIYSTSKNWY